MKPCTALACARNAVTMQGQPGKMAAQGMQSGSMDPQKVIRHLKPHTVGIEGIKADCF